MKSILILKDEDFGLKQEKHVEITKRFAARAVLLKGDKIALMNVTKENHHKLPGGGVEKNETLKEALFRELIEETGCKAKIISEIGKIIEHKTHMNILQTSYCYIAKVTNEGKPQFDEGELESGFRLEWMSINFALKILEKENPDVYERKFIRARDLKILREAKNRLK